MSYTSHTRADLSTAQRMMTDAIAIFLSTHKIPESDRELLIEAGKIIAKAKPKDSTQSQTKSYITNRAANVNPTKEEESAIDKIVRAVMAAKRLDAEGSTKAYAKWEEGGNSSTGAGDGKIHIEKGDHPSRNDIEGALE